jgi:hypothetical protein
MNNKLKMAFIFLGWIILSGFGGLGVHAAGCALQAAVEVLPPALKLVDKGIKAGLKELDEISNASESPKKIIEEPTSNSDNNWKEVSNNFSNWDNKLVCSMAVQSGTRQWAPDSNPHVREAFKRGLSKQECVQLLEKFNRVEIAAASTPNKYEATREEKLFKSCPGTYKPSWNNCIGTRTYSDKAVYKGPWKSGKQHGQGTLTYSDGEKYVGSFKDGLHHGKGTITYPNGKVMKGIWENDKFKSERK